MLTKRRLLTRLPANSRTRAACWSWAVVAVVGVVVGLQYLVGPPIAERATHLGESAVPPALWNAIDYLLVVWLVAPELGCVVLGLAAFATWRVVLRRDERLRSWFSRGSAIAGAVASSLGAIVLAVLAVPSACVSLTQAALCKTTTFEEALSPNGRYRATVLELDCGAMSSTNRHVVLARRHFPWATSPILYFNGSPSLHLSWSGRTLTIRGERSRKSMDDPPPEVGIWGGVLIRYEGPNT